MALTGISHEWDSMGIAIRKLDSETEDAYQAFLSYAWLVGTERKHATVATRLGYILAEIKEWARANDWSERASAVDAIRWTMEMKSRNDLISEDNKRFVQENQQVKNNALRVSQKMLKEAERLLDQALVADEVQETGFITLDDGRQVATTTIVKMKSRVSDIPRLVDTAIKTSRLVQDLPTEIVENHLPLGADLESLSLDELMQLRETNLKAINQKSGLGKVDQISNASN